MAIRKKTDVKQSLFDFKILIMHIQRYKIVSAFFIISLIFFLAGILIEDNIMKFAAIGIILLGGLSVHLTWAQPKFMSEKVALFNVAVATSHSFLFLGFLLGLLFVMDSFIIKIENISFTIFGSVILSIIVACIYLAYKLRDYM